MEIGDHGVHGNAQAVLAQQFGGDAERIVVRLHEQATHDLQHQRAAAVGEVDHDRAMAGCAGREVQRAQQARLGFDVAQQFLAVPGVVAEGNDVGAGGEQVGGHGGCEAEAVAGVFAVHHDQIEGKGFAQAGQGGDDCVAAGAADDVAEEEYAQAGSGSGCAAVHGQAVFGVDGFQFPVMRTHGHLVHPQRGITEADRLRITV